MNGLKGKRVLLFAPDFFGYDIEIKNKLQHLGAVVDLYNERPSSNLFIKAIIRVYKKVLSGFTDRYFNKIININKHKSYDYIFVIKGEVFNEQIINRLKSAFPQAETILYLWDSIKNYKSIRDCLQLFDRKLTFDINDSNEIPSLIFRPLFYLDDYSALKKPDMKIDGYKYDLLFIGTVHSDRWIFLKNLRDQAEGLNLKVYYYLYIQSRCIFIIQKLINKEFRNIPFSEVLYKPVYKENIINLLANSGVMLDIHHPKQTGLTMRTIEVIGSGRKLVTTNATIKEYDFYSPQNILVIDRNNPKISSSFFKNEYEELPEILYKKYSVNGWIKDVFNLADNE